jgi:5-methylcytosine-specific restriction endonuclease McrA
MKTQEEIKAYKADWIKKRREKLKDAWFLANGPCRICGSWEDLELDHLDPMSKFTHRIWSYSEPVRIAELAKCQALCHECHKAKTIEAIKQPVRQVSDYNKRERSYRAQRRQRRAHV